ncbi:MAG: HD-GYP domain-containing protein, partial [Nitrospinota bacterium]
SELAPGIFIHDLNCGWLENPFMTKSFLIEDYGTVNKIIKQKIHAVYIDTEKGDDIKHAPTKEEADKKTESEVRRVVEEERKEDQQPENRIPMKKEIEQAKKVRNEAKKVVTDVLNDIKLGKQIETEKVTHVVNNMVESIFNNRHALTSLSRIKNRDEYTFQHSVNVCVLMLSFARTFKIDRETMGKIGTGALLHDIGKMKIPDEVLHKEGKLTDEEFSVMKSHVVESVNILSETEGIPEIASKIAGQHHERYDGTGYPEGLKGKDISAFGRMAAIVDVYDAITSSRCYHHGMEPSMALKKIFDWSKYHFDETMVQNFIRCVGIYPVGTLVMTDSKFLGVVIEPGEESMLHPVLRLVYNVKHDHFIEPRDLDLSKNGGKADKIVGTEDPKKWNINTLKYIDLF